MFVRKVTREYPSGPVDYLYLLQGYRDQGKVRQRVVANLGRADVLAAHLESVLRLLRPYLDAPLAPLGAVQAPQALSYGGPLVARTLWTLLGLDTILTRHCGAEVADRAWVLVAHRLLHPGSEHALAWWLEESYVTDRQGQRWRAQWGARGRVRVQAAQLQRWYRTLDQVCTVKDAIEEDLYVRLRDLFGLQVDLVFFDITSTYCEGHGPEGLARHGHSRDGRPRHRQVLIAVVMASGWPIASYVREGQRLDHQLVEPIVADVRRRCAVQRVVWVADRGMVTAATLAVMTQGEDRYLVGLQRRRNPRAQAVLAVARGPWQSLPESGTVTEVRLPDDVARYVVVRSPERRTWERARRRQAMRRGRDRLRRLTRAVTAGRVRAPEKIGARAGAILQEDHGGRYFDWRLTPEGRFQFWVDRAKLRAELRVEGTYLLQTNDPRLDAVAAVHAYKDLQIVERGFRCLKDVLAVRPVYHQTARRVRAHLFVAHLALVLGIALEKALRRAKVEMALDTALEALRPVRLVTLELDQQRTQVITRPTPYAQAVLKAVGLRHLEPPEPCSEIA